MIDAAEHAGKLNAESVILEPPDRKFGERYLSTALFEHLTT